MDWELHQWLNRLPFGNRGLKVSLWDTPTLETCTRPTRPLSPVRLELRLSGLATRSLTPTVSQNSIVDELREWDRSRNPVYKHVVDIVYIVLCSPNVDSICPRRHDVCEAAAEGKARITVAPLDLPKSLAQKDTRVGLAESQEEGKCMSSKWVTLSEASSWPRRELAACSTRV